MIKLNQNAFTIPELAISLGVAAIVTGILMVVTIGFYGGILREDARSRLTIESQQILRNMVDDLRVSSSVKTIGQNTDSNSPGGGWQTDASNNTLVMASPVIGTSGDYEMDELTGYPYQNEVIYHNGNGSLYKRTVADENAPTNLETTSCPEASSSPSCPADPVISSNFSNLDLVFYDQDNVLTTDPSLARSVEISVQLEDSIFGADVSVNNNIRITLRNSTP